MIAAVVTVVALVLVAGLFVTLNLNEARRAFSPEAIEHVLDDNESETR